MKRISLFVAVCLLAFGGVFTSCDSEETLSDVQEVAEDVTSSEENEDGMFTVSFVNPDGTPYVPDGETKADWKGSSTKYPYKTAVYANWSDFKSDNTDKVDFSGGDDGSAELSSSSSAYTIAREIDKNYTVSVTKKHYVEINTGVGGGVTSSGSDWYDHGSTITVTATPNSGYEFSKFVTNSGWEVTDNPKNFSVNSCFTVTAYFKQKAAEATSYTLTVKIKATGIEVGKSDTYAINANNIASGSSIRNVMISTSGTKTATFSIKAGTTTTVNASSANEYYGYYFSDSGGKSTTVTMDSDKEIVLYVNY